MTKVITMDPWKHETHEITDFWQFTPKATVLVALRFRYPFAVIVKEKSK